MNKNPVHYVGDENGDGLARGNDDEDDTDDGHSDDLCVQLLWHKNSEKITGFGAFTRWGIPGDSCADRSLRLQCNPSTVECPHGTVEGHPEITEVPNSMSRRISRVATLSSLYSSGSSGEEAKLVRC